MNHTVKKIALWLPAASMILLTGCASVNKSVLSTPPAEKGGAIVMKTSMATNEDAFVAGRQAAQQLAARLDGTAPHAVLMADCFDSKELKEKAIAGVASVFKSDLIFGGAVYGMYTQDGASNADSVALLALAGSGLQIQTALSENMGASTLSMETQNDELIAALNAGGAALAAQLPDTGKSDLIILMGDAHSPKNQFLLDGLQSAAGKTVPVTGGSISKHDGLNYVYYRGKMYRDSAIAICINGDFSVAQSGRQAKSNDEVISTAKEGSLAAMRGLGAAKPFALIAYDCAGRMGKLAHLSDELNAIQSNVPSAVPIFGCYCAGEFGPADVTIEKTTSVSTGRGWHVMFSVLGK